MRIQAAIRNLLVVFVTYVVAATTGTLSAQSPKPVNELPQTAELPNPFLFADGVPVQTAADWQRRRAELKNLFEDYVYGHLPPKPQKMTVKRGEPVADSAGSLTMEDLVLRFEHAGKALSLGVRLVLPAGNNEKVPVIVQGAFGRRPGQPAAPPDGERYRAYASRGYAVAEVDFQQAAPDNRELPKTSGVYQLFGGEIDCGALMAWAWAVHRTVDAIETIPPLDANKVIVTGHSRYGKAALIAGAFDERIALTVPSHSGCAGCAPFRLTYGNAEQLHNIVGGFPYWFRPDFNQFVGNVERLPVDQHELMALVAPRALLHTEGTQDAWTNPEGAQVTHLAAKKSYEFLGADDRISARYRPVGHIPSIEDLLEYADYVFFSKPLSDEFGRLPYSEAVGAFSWDMPE